MLELDMYEYNQMGLLFLANASSKVFKQRLMRNWGSRTPKRSVMWSSSKRVGLFRTGKLKRGHGADCAKALVTKYRNAHGEKRFQGNKNMAKSATLVFV